MDTAVFEVTVTLIDTATNTPGLLWALNLNTLTAQYTDTTPASGTSVKVATTATVETAGPVFSNFSPPDRFSTQNTQPLFSGTISDSGSGLKVNNIIVKINGIDNVPTITGSDGDLQVTFTVIPAALPAGDIFWQVRATDIAGNTGVSDSDPNVFGSQFHTVRIDQTPPSFAAVGAITGNFWDAVDDVVDDNDPSSIEVLFDENLDAASVSATDFIVDGLTPLSAEVFSDLKSSVFLTLANDLFADAEPTVAIAAGGAVSDLAGNALNVGSVTARDGIAPSFTVTLDKTITNNVLTISVSADEKIAGLPTVEIWKDPFDADPERTLAVVVKTLTSWEAEFSIIGGSDGDKSVLVIGNDLASPPNTGTKGKTDPNALGAIVFEQDTVISAPTFDPVKSGMVFTITPLSELYTTRR